MIWWASPAGLDHREASLLKKCYPQMLTSSPMVRLHEQIPVWISGLPRQWSTILAFLQPPHSDKQFCIHLVLPFLSFSSFLGLRFACGNWNGSYCSVDLIVHLASFCRRFFFSFLLLLCVHKRAKIFIKIRSCMKRKEKLEQSRSFNYYKCFWLNHLERPDF